MNHLKKIEESIYGEEKTPTEKWLDSSIEKTKEKIKKIKKDRKSNQEEVII